MEADRVPLAFERQATLLNQPLEVEAWGATFMAVCQQGHPPQHVFIPGLAPMIGVCDTCQRGYRINGLSALVGQPLQVQLTILMPKEGALVCPSS